MRTVFADTFYFIAVLDSSDPQHEAAVTASRDRQRRFLTTEYVMIELADAFCAVGARAEFAALYEVISHDAAFRIIPASPELLRRGMEIYRRHQDKDWQLTDCLSFAVMRQHHVRTALTGDTHFEQAGFTALLK